jgi:hypothetical protein
MNIAPGPRSQGSVLVVTLLTASIIGIGVTSYLLMVSHQNYSTMRSLAWNTAIPLAEAGIEDALTHLNLDNNLTANNWLSKDVNGQTVYKKRYDFTADASYYSVTISNAATAPVIFSQGSVPGPLGRGNATRAVRVTTVPKGFFRPAILTKGTIKPGSEFATDSFDSSDPAYSTGGKYDPAKTKANGNLASIATAPGAIEIQDAKIAGHIYTPPTGSYTLGANGMVGDQNFLSNTANAGKVQPGFYSNDLNTTIPDASAPPGWQSYPYPVGGLVGGVFYTAILASGNYQLPAGATLSGPILVLGDATLYVPQDGRIQFNNADVINISSSFNASLKLYNASSSDAVFGDISNDSGLASRFSYYGLPTTAGTKTTLANSGTYPFAGTLYAPNQDVVVSGSGDTLIDFSGAITANSFSLSGQARLHFDEALARAGGLPRFVIDSYTEIAASPNF